MGFMEEKFVVLGVCGGIAAYRTCELTRLLSADGAEVQAVLTESAVEFVGPLTFQALTGRPAEVGRGGQLARSGMPHLELGRRADLMVVAPVTANTLAKLACGLADNLLTSTVLSSDCPVVLAPAMNTRMWNNPVTQQNLERLRRLERMLVVGPASGELACGEQGVGRMEEPEVIWEAARGCLSKKDLVGQKIIVTAGPTREPLDPVRFLSNRSSGRMGYALAAAARRRGAEVVLVSGPTFLRPPWGVKLVQVITAGQMQEMVEKHYPDCNLVLMAAAVADFTPRKTSRQKIKKEQGPETIELKRTPDILASLGKNRQEVLLVGFAAETGDPVAGARQKLEAKNLDLVVANDVSLPDAGFEVDTNRVHLVGRRDSEELPLLPKEEVAERILDRVVKMLAPERS